MTHIEITPPRLEAGPDPGLHSLLHPSLAFDHPREVVNDPHLSLAEKRAILSSWASDAGAVESAPALRRPAWAKRPVAFDEIVDALQSLDDDPPPRRPGGKSMRQRSDPSGSDREGAVRL